MRKKRTYLLLSGILILLVIYFPFVSAGFSDIWDSIKQNPITGRATSGSTSINITVGASPTIDFVSTLAAQDVSENTFKYVVFNFTATDADGAGDLNPATATVRLNRTGEAERANSSCAISGSTFANSQNFTCQIQLWYFDGAGDWTINASIQDDGGNLVNNHTQTFTVNSLTAMTLHPASLSWPSIAATDTNIQASDDPAVINNTGNSDVSSPDVEVTAINLIGEVTPSDVIFAGNFTVDETNACDAGPTMVNGTATGITGASLNAGNNSINDGSTGQEQLFFCLEALNPGLSSQAYSTGAGGAWTIGIS